MTPEQYRRLGRLFEAASTIPTADRIGFLDAECGEDVELKDQVLALLAAERNAPEFFLAKPALEVAADLLAASQQGDDMPGIAPGARFGAYRIERLIGRGGMGAVYEGFDLKLQRKAAIKILPAQFAGNADRVRRFQLEARAASQLNHPNIVSIYDADFDGGHPYIAAELIEGTTLRELIAAGSVARKTVLEIGSQICAALAAAHDAGIIHRDIKPENVMVRPDGIVKVLDFGLAKLTESATGPANVHTQPGSIAGTVHYMSPEQVTGQPCGPQSDIFSAAVVLFELALGSRPFEGPTDGAIFLQIVNMPPARASELAAGFDTGFAALIMRALQKDPELRFQTAHDLRAALRLLLLNSQPPQSADLLSPPPAAERPAIPKQKHWHSLVAAAVSGMAIASIFWYWSRPKEDLHLPRSFARMTFGDGEELFPNLFPDGKQFIYASSARGHWDIYLQRTGGSAAINLTPDTTVDNSEPALSQDGSKIAFRSEREGGGLFVMEATGENPRRIAAKGNLPAWSPDGKSIVYCDSTFVTPHDRGASVSRLHILDLASGTERQLNTGDAVQPNWSPHGNRIAYWGVYPGGKRQIFTVRADGASNLEPVTNGDAVDVNPVWAPSGREMYFTSDRGGTMNVWRVAIDERSGKISGGPEPLTTPSPYVQFLSWSKDGSKLLYSQGHNQISLSYVDFDPSQLQVTGHPVSAGGSNNVGNFSISPDGSRIVYDTVGDPEEDLWIVNADGSGRRKLMSDRYRDRLPSWSPSGEQILFISNRTGSYQEYLIRPDGSRLQPLTAAEVPVNAGVWINDGKEIIASLFQRGLARLNPQGAIPIQQISVLPGIPPSQGSYAFVSPAQNGMLLGHINGTGENPIVMYSLGESKLSSLGVRGTRPFWLPGSDNRYFLFLRADACYLYDRRQAKEKQLFRTSHDQLYFMQLAPGGTRIYYTQTIRDAQIWMAEVSQ